MENTEVKKENKQFLLDIYKEISINRSEIYARKILEELIERRFLFTDRDSFYLFYLVRLLVIMLFIRLVIIYLLF